MNWGARPGNPRTVWRRSVPCPAMADPAPKVAFLLVDDDPLMHEAVSAAVERFAEGPIEILHAYSPSEGLALLDAAPGGALVVLSDYDMGAATNGVAMLRCVQERR